MFIYGIALYLSVAQPYDPSGIICNILFMRYYNHGIAAFIDLLEQLHYIYRRFGVEVSCRLICQNYGRLVYQRPRNCHSLPLSAGEFGRPVFRPIPKPHII